MATRNWDGLSSSYRQRLERAGITRAAYERGVSVTAARGHEKTPERPERAITHPEKYKEYLSRRRNLETKVISKKEKMFGNAKKYSRKRSAANVRNAPMHLLSKFLKDPNPFEDEDLYGYEEDGDEENILWYH